MSDFIHASGDTASVLKAIAILAQKLSDDFEMFVSDCDNFNARSPHRFTNGGCLINTALDDGCSILNCPLAKE